MRVRAPSHNAETFTPDGYFSTGDLGSLATGRRPRFAGRSSEMIKRSGINVSPAEVEEVLQQHPSVGLAGVTGVADPVRGEIIVAYCGGAARGARSTDERLLAHCRDDCRATRFPIACTFARPCR